MKNTRNIADLPTSAPMRPRHGRRFRAGLTEGAQSSYTARRSFLANAIAYDAAADMPGRAAHVAEVLAR